MSDREFDDYAEKDWENHEEMAWNEFDWQLYLKDNEIEIDQFLNLYHHLKENLDNLDDIAHAMGWESEEWSQDEDEEPGTNSNKSEINPQFHPSEAYLPYTVHKHPIYIVTKGLCKYISNCWEYLCVSPKSKLSAIESHRFGNGLHSAESNAIMAVNALDIGDFNISVCHLKRALNAINLIMHLLNKTAEKNKEESQFINKKIIPVCFDLREMWIRVMSECREEVRQEDNE